MASSATLLAAALAASACFPSGVMATAETWSAAAPTDTVSATRTSDPWIERTEIVPSARLATSARSPLGLTAMPEGCLPTVDGADHLGRARLQIDDEDLVVGLQPMAPSLNHRHQRVGDEGDVARRHDREVGRRPDDRVDQRDRRRDARRTRIRDVDHRQSVVTGLADYRLEVPVDPVFLVVADDQGLSEDRDPPGADQGASQNGCRKKRRTHPPLHRFAAPPSARPPKLPRSRANDKGRRSNCNPR